METVSICGLNAQDLVALGGWAAAALMPAALVSRRVWRWLMTPAPVRLEVRELLRLLEDPKKWKQCGPSILCTSAPLAISDYTVIASGMEVRGFLSRREWGLVQRRARQVYQLVLERDAPRALAVAVGIGSSTEVVCDAQPGGRPDRRGRPLDAGAGADDEAA